MHTTLLVVTRVVLRARIITLVVLCIVRAQRLLLLLFLLGSNTLLVGVLASIIVI